MNRTTLMISALAIGLSCAPLQAQLVPVNPPSFYTPDIGYYASWTWPNAGWSLIVGAPGDGNSNPASSASGARVRRAGIYSVNGQNIVEAWCSPNYYWIYQGYGTQPFTWIYNTVSTTPTNGNCFFGTTVGDALRTSVLFPPTPPPPPQTIGFPAPNPNAPYSFDVAAFAQNVKSALDAGNPTPVGYQLAVRNPQGQIVYNSAFGSVTGSTSLPATSMTVTRRMDVASMSKTITATAAMAALEDLATRQPALGITLDSSIRPYLPATWNPPASVGNVTFRNLLRHTSGFCKPGAPAGDFYNDVKAMVEAGPETASLGKFRYCNSDYALLRILIAYIVDGPKAYKPFESNPDLNAKITALSYRNYVRSRVLAPIGLSAVDVFYTGPLPETIYFIPSKVAIGDKLNIPGVGYDQTANNMVLGAGSGNWTLSAAEYSRFISNLWMGKIVSPASVATMLAQNDPDAWAVGMGMYGSTVYFDGATRWNYNHAGGGGYNGGNAGPQAVWMTFFNGYTAVLISNTAWGLTKVAYQLMQDSFLPALGIP